MKKLIGFVGAIVLCTSLSGCIKDTTDLTIDSSDKISGTAYFGTLDPTLTPSASPDPSASPSPSPSCTPADYTIFPSTTTNLSVTDVCEGGYSGKKYTFNQTPLSDFNNNTKSGHGFSLNRVGTTLNLEGTFDFTSKDLKGLISSGDDVHFSFTFATPVTTTNGTLSNSNKTVTWTFTEDGIYTIAASVQTFSPIGAKPDISGIMQVGQTLTASLQWFNIVPWMSYDDWFTSFIAPVYTYTVVWKRNGVEIAGAGHAMTYTLTPSDLNSKISIVVNLIPKPNKNAQSASLTSDQYSNVAAALQTLTPIPTISGINQVGSTVTANPGTWDTSVVNSYVWRRNGTAIPGATNQSYTLKPEDQGKSVTVVVTGTKTGYVTASQPSSAITVQAVPEPPMTYGHLRVGTTLYATQGEWPDGTSLIYSWNSRRCNACAPTVFSGSTYNKDYFVLSSREMFYAMRVCVSDAANVLPTRCSDYTSTVQVGIISPASNPTISGTGRKGTYLSVNPGSWQRGTHLTYQWTKNGTPISGAHSTIYRITPTDVGAHLNVRVTGSLTGYTTSSRTATHYVSGKN